MSFKETVARIYREHAAHYKGAPVPRAELIESATADLLIEVRAGRLTIDSESAIRAALMQADESDGRAADRIIARAARGEVPLSESDLDVIVTLGKGMRKPWGAVTAEDIDAMNSLRFENMRKTREAYSAFNADVLAIRDLLKEHGTFGAAYAAGGFPPAEAKFEGAAA